MTDDRRLDSRFAMIMEEMTNEPELPQPPPQLRIELRADGYTLTCPRCDFTAFELRRDGSVAGVVCLGCPDNPWYPLPADVELVGKRYRCGRCGTQRRVTTTLSEVNLHCVQCKVLTLHSELQAQPSATGVVAGTYINSEIIVSDGTGRGGGGGGGGRGVLITSVFSKDMMDAINNARVELKKGANVLAMITASTPISDDEVEFIGPSVVGGTGIPMVNWITNKIRKKLGLKEFDVFSTQKRFENLNNPELKPRDASRRTGRTWKGILEAIAECQVGRVKLLWILSSSPRYDQDLRRQVYRLRDAAQMDYPHDVCAGAPGIAEFVGDERYTPPPNTIIYVDHTFYERSRR